MAGGHASEASFRPSQPTRAKRAFALANPRPRERSELSNPYERSELLPWPSGQTHIVARSPMLVGGRCLEVDGTGRQDWSKVSAGGCGTERASGLAGRGARGLRQQGTVSAGGTQRSVAGTSGRDAVTCLDHIKSQKGRGLSSDFLRGGPRCSGRDATGETRHGL